MSDRYEQAQLKPTNITIREFGSVIGVECLYLYKNPNDDVWTPTCTHGTGFIVAGDVSWVWLFYCLFFCYMLKYAVYMRGEDKC